MPQSFLPCSFQPSKTNRCCGEFGRKALRVRTAAVSFDPCIACNPTAEIAAPSDVIRKANLAMLGFRIYRNFAPTSDRILGPRFFPTFCRG